jgi:predicted transcriptional regulator
VRAELGDTLAYTTVATTLNRLLDKGAVSRTIEGRHHVYAPILDGNGIIARRMRLLMEAGADQASVLSHFVAELSPADEAALRAALRGDTT